MICKALNRSRLTYASMSWVVCVMRFKGSSMVEVGDSMGGKSVMKRGPYDVESCIIMVLIKLFLFWFPQSLHFVVQR